GDAFERQIMPRPHVHFPIEMALEDTDRQLLSNGITTAFHGITVSWEPGLRSLDNAAKIVASLERLGARLGCDTRLHIRWETFAFDAMDTVRGWLRADPAPILAFNDHLTPSLASPPPPHKLESWAKRAGLAGEEYLMMMQALWARRDEVPGAIAEMAAAARAAGAVLLAHDERTAEERRRFRALGAVTSEFPMTRDTAAEARAAGEAVVLGAPNVVRGGSHNGMLTAADAVRDGLCTVLASDYYYPAPLHAAFRLWREGLLSLAEAWALVSANAAAAACLSDRGAITPGLRADLVVIDDSDPALPRVVEARVAGASVHSAG
ncbi:MAG: alpha-D-ribose 1-methylphosphonate 5-triphosphate diphosphatase, partial [Pseudomonadota bacterium]